ncbi:hypothetical protein L1D14_10645 [Vibrio tubiashii]|uniref:hypothetical protein n=1 Tax=Vibrio tubiashii TaxID=29498 RepID=UPI001EFDA95E|nr:hypothetical protein [Vibrio tubiashii]MCG9576696.1 hypothetical protein [Vibrio tubiashii]
MELVIALVKVLIVSAIFIRVVTAVYRFFAYAKTPFGFRGELVFLDKGQVRGFAFFNRRFLIGSTPDAIYRTNINQIHIVEQKSRKKGIYDSDIAQAEIGALTVSESNMGTVTHITVANQTQTLTKRVPSPRKIARKYKKEIQIAREIKNGKHIDIRKPEPAKCRSCRYFNECKNHV